MNVKEARDYFNSLDSKLDNLELWMQDDDEGNGYHIVSGFDETSVKHDLTNDYRQDSISNLDSTAEENCMSKNEWALCKKKGRCVVVF